MVNFVKNKKLALTPACLNDHNSATRLTASKEEIAKVVDRVIHSQAILTFH
jgi:hypothetical protein